MNNMTRHAQVDRFDRLAKIVDTVGFGNEYCTITQADGALKTLTTTGIVIVRNETTKKIITAYPATLNQAKAIMVKRTGSETLPHSLFKAVMVNQKIF